MSIKDWFVNAVTAADVAVSLASPESAANIQEQAAKQVELERTSSITQNYRDADVAGRVENEPKSSMPNGR